MIAPAEAADAAYALDEMLSAARLIIAHARAGSYYPEPWVLACVLDRARHWQRTEYCPALGAILYFVGTRSARLN